MSNRAGDIRLLFGTEEHTFRLTVARWEKVQEACQAGPPEIARRLSLALLGRGGLSTLQAMAAGRYGDWKVQDVRAVLLHGLIGGGMAAEKAELTCREFVDERPLLDSVGPAHDVVMASLFGPPEEPLRDGEDGDATAGEPAGGAAPNPPRSRTAKSGSRKSGASPRS